MSAKPKSGSGVPPRKQKERPDASASLGNESQNATSPEWADEGGEQVPKLLDELIEVLAA
jgi:hypothetical protein